MNVWREFMNVFPYQRYGNVTWECFLFCLRGTWLLRTQNCWLGIPSGLSGNARKLLDQSEAMKRREFSGTWPKVSEVWGISYDSITNGRMGRRTDGQAHSHSPYKSDTRLHTEKLTLENTKKGMEVKFINENKTWKMPTLLTMCTPFPLSSHLWVWYGVGHQVHYNNTVSHREAGDCSHLPPIAHREQRHASCSTSLWGETHWKLMDYPHKGQSHKSISAHVPYPTIRHIRTEMCIFLLQKLWNMGQVHCGIWGIGLFSYQNMRPCSFRQWMRYDFHESA